MREYYPLIVVGGVIGLISIVFSLAYAFIKNKKEAIGFDRNMKDGEIVRRLLAYAKPHWRSFGFAGLCMAFSIAYDIASPLLIGYIEEIVSTEFAVETENGMLKVTLQAECREEIGKFVPDPTTQENEADP